MPTVTNQRLTLTESNGQVRIRVRADVTFSAFERQLAGLGQSWHPHITIHDFDGSNGDPGAQVLEFLTDAGDRLASFDVPVGPGGSETLPLDERKTVDREELKVDAENDDDELKAVIRIHTNDAQVEFTPDAVTEDSVLAD